MPRKYRNKPIWVEGTKFDSRAEAKRYRELSLLQAAGEIKDLWCQPVFPIEINGKPVRIRSEKRPNGTKTKYTADFQYTDNRTGETIVEDVKGMDTAASRFRRAVVEAIYDIQITIIKVR